MVIVPETWRAGQMARVKAAPGKIFPGAVREVGQIVDSRSRSRPDGVAETLISIGDPQQNEPLLDPAIRPGTTSEVSLELYNVSRARVFPWGSLIPGPTGATLLEADGASRPVALLLSDGLAGGIASETLPSGFRFRMPGGSR
jgi:hypothetical protein